MPRFPDNPAQILIIDDNPGDVEILRGALSEQREPYELTVLKDGEAGLGFVADHRSGVRRSEPCVIVLDLNLPKHDALAVLSAIKAEPVLSHIRVMVISDFVESETQTLVLAMGGFYLKKPRNRAGMLELAVRLLALCKMAQPLGNVRRTRRDSNR